MNDGASMHDQPDRLADFTTDRRVLLLSLMAAVIGGLAALVAKALVWLIALITNLAYFQRFSTAAVSPTASRSIASTSSSGSRTAT